MRSCISKVYNEHRSQYFSPNSANQAVLNVLELLLAVFQAEPHLKNPDDRAFRPFRNTFLEDKEFTMQMLFSVDCSQPSSIQIASVELMRQLFGKSPYLISSLDENVQSALIKALGQIYSHTLLF